MKTNIEIEVEVLYDFQPYEPATREYPGNRAEVTINAVEINTFDIMMNLSPTQMEDLEQQCLLCEVKEPEEL
tara:strand:+ start:299 stop:514 length:216 start_codon:yes stop_codon:yes gene_type:complete